MTKSLAFGIIVVALIVAILVVRWIARRLPATRPGRNFKRGGMALAVLALPIAVGASSLFWIGEVFTANYEPVEHETLGTALIGLLALPLEMVVVFWIYMMTVGSVVIALSLILLLLTAWICWDSLPDTLPPETTLPDTTPETGPKMGPETGPETRPDSTPDIPPDIPPDATPETGPPDAAKSDAFRSQGATAQGHDISPGTPPSTVQTEAIR